MATGEAPAGLSRCFNGACWWMTPLLYHSMLCHLQRQTALTHSSPPEDVVLLLALRETNMNFKKTQTNKAYLLWKNFLMIRKELDYSKWPADEASNADHSDTRTTSCRRWPRHDALSWWSSTQQPGWKRSGSCLFIWLKLWGRAAVSREKRRAESAELKPPQQTRYGADQGAPPSSSCPLSEPY